MINKKKFFIVFVFIITIFISFSVGLFFNDIRNLFLHYLKTESETTQNIEEQTLEITKEETSPYIAKELGYTKFVSAKLHNMPFDADSSFMRDITFDFTFTNKLLLDGVKTFSLLQCEYTYDGENLRYFDGIGKILDKLIALNEEAQISLQSGHFYSPGICDYISTGERQCVNNETNITVNSCILGYSTASDHILGERSTVSSRDEYLNFIPNEFDNNTDVLELVKINKTSEIGEYSTSF